MKRFLALLMIFCVGGMFGAPAAIFAACTDQDGDRYYVCDDPDDPDLSRFAKGLEEEACDQVNIGEDHGSPDWQDVVAPGVSIRGNKVHPGAIEPPNGKIDMNCDGQISGYFPEGRAGDTDLFGMVEQVITLIGQVAVFISVGALIYGGIMFATASGEETKIQKAKKTIIGAVIGLIVGLIAWNIVGFVTDTFGS